MTAALQHHTGGCLCESVRYEIHGPLRAVIACHCQQCQKTSGHYVSATAARKKDVEITQNSGLKWYRSSDSAERGFCVECGGNLFWREINSENISIFAGTLDQPSGLQTAGHIFTSDKADYYELSDELPKFKASGLKVAIPET